MWLWLTLLASICWGASYVIAEILLKKNNIPYSIILLSTSIFTFGFWIFLNVFTQSSVITSLKSVFSNNTVLAMILINSILIVLALIFTYMAIGEKNAALVTFLEISYPVFVVLFSLLLIPNFILNVYHVIGFVLIFSGAMILSMY